MFVRSQPEFLRSPDVDTGIEPALDPGAVVESLENDPPEEGGEPSHEGGKTPPEKLSLRDELAKNFEADRKPARQPRKAKDPNEAPAGTQQDPPLQQQVDAPPAPEALTKEAKAEWAKTPPAIQAAFVKREQDMAKGVQELKAKYDGIDRALAPHIEAIRRTGNDAPAAITHLFAWFQALSQNPKEAFPALAKSFNLDLANLVPKAAGQAQPGQQEPGKDGQPGPVPPEVQTYITGLEQKLDQVSKLFEQKIGSLESTFAQQSQAKTEEVLMSWAKDKPMFEDVRGMMAQLIASGAVPLNNGQVDLDKAYDMAVYAIPEVRTKVLAEQRQREQDTARQAQEKERQAQTAAADKARKAGVSITGGAPGAPGAQVPGAKRGKGKSVRESLMEAKEQLTS